MIQNKAIIVTLSISQWAARKYDKNVTREIEANHQAKDAGRYNKILAAKEYLKEIQKKAGDARTFHYENTLPWGENGERLLPSANYFEYSGKMMLLKSEFNTAVSEFIKNYPDVVADAKVRLNGMFNAHDYPSALELEGKFSFKNSFSPIPDNDFRVQIGAGEVEKLKANLEAEQANRLNGAMRDIWDRVKNVLLAVSERLSQPDAIFRDSLFGNIEDLVRLLPKLNLTNDAALNNVCSEISKLIVEPDNVRNDSLLRARKAQEADNILKQFNEYFG